MRGALPPLLRYAFMARCSVKAQGQLYVSHTPINTHHGTLEEIWEYGKSKKLMCPNFIIFGSTES
jgi:hypothetical protein